MVLRAIHCPACGRDLPVDSQVDCATIACAGCDNSIIVAQSQGVFSVSVVPAIETQLTESSLASTTATQIHVVDCQASSSGSGKRAELQRFLEDRQNSYDAQFQKLLAAVQETGGLPEGCEFLWSEAFSNLGERPLLGRLFFEANVEMLRPICDSILREAASNRDLIRSREVPMLQMLANAARKGVPKRELLSDCLMRARQDETSPWEALLTNETLRTLLLEVYPENVAILRSPLVQILDQLRERMVSFDVPLEILQAARNHVPEQRRQELSCWLRIRDRIGEFNEFQKRPANLMSRLTGARSRVVKDLAETLAEECGRLVRFGNWTDPQKTFIRILTTNCEPGPFQNELITDIQQSLGKRVNPPALQPPEAKPPVAKPALTKGVAKSVAKVTAKPTAKAGTKPSAKTAAPPVKHAPIDPPVVKPISVPVVTSSPAPEVTPVAESASISIPTVPIAKPVPTPTFIAPPNLSGGITVPAAGNGLPATSNPSVHRGESSTNSWLLFCFSILVSGFMAFHVINIVRRDPQPEVPIADRPDQPDVVADDHVVDAETARVPSDAVAGEEALKSSVHVISNPEPPKFVDPKPELGKPVKVKPDLIREPLVSPNRKLNLPTSSSGWEPDRLYVATQDQVSFNIKRRVWKCDGNVSHVTIHGPQVFDVESAPTRHFDKQTAMLISRWTDLKTIEISAMIPDAQDAVSIVNEIPIWTIEANDDEIIASASEVGLATYNRLALNAQKQIESALKNSVIAIHSPNKVSVLAVAGTSPKVIGALKPMSPAPEIRFDTRSAVEMTYLPGQLWVIDGDSAIWFANRNHQFRVGNGPLDFHSGEWKLESWPKSRLSPNGVMKFENGIVSLGVAIGSELIRTGAKYSINSIDKIFHDPVQIQKGMGGGAKGAR